MFVLVSVQISAGMPDPSGAGKAFATRKPGLPRVQFAKHTRRIHQYVRKAIAWFFQWLTSAYDPSIPGDVP